MDRNKRNLHPSSTLNNTMFIDPQSQLQYDKFKTNEKINKRRKRKNKNISVQETGFNWPV